jgi:hypothetical protein
MQCRFPVAFQLVFSVVTIILLFWLPESPRWLAKHGDHEESRAVIARLTGQDIPLNHPEVEKLQDHIQGAIQLELAG